MTRQTALSALLFATLLPAQHTIDCGGEGMRTCTWKDWEAYNMTYWYRTSCEPDLKERNGLCVNDTRRQLGTPYTWKHWALNQQLQVIGANEPVNFLQWPGAHNAYSNAQQGFKLFLTQNHHYSLTDLFNYGVRHIEMDPHYYGAAGRFDVRLCHGSSTGQCLLIGWETRLFAHALIEINNWLAANPNEILIMKLDDKLSDFNAGSDGFTPLVNLLETHLGPRIYKYSTVNYDPTYWPTPNEIKRAGKQLLVTIHNSGPHRNEWVWDAKGKVLADNWPRSQNFTTCTASDGTTATNRALLNWWDTAEGRSGSNIFTSSFLLTSETGLYQPGAQFDANSFITEGERKVSEAVLCGVSIVGMDYIAALETPAFLSSAFTDTRLEEMVWSWKENDFGQAGPAMFEFASRRWVSRPATENHPYICGMRRTTPGLIQTRQWRLTPDSGPFNKITGNNACVANFGPSYEFAYPTTGFQQGELNKAISANAWINYSVAPVPNLSLEQNPMSFTMTLGGDVPATTAFNLIGPAGMALAKNNTPRLPDWIEIDFATKPLIIGPNGRASGTIRFTDAVKLLPAGRHTAKANIVGAFSGYPDTVITLDVFLNVRLNSGITLSGPTSVSWNSTSNLTGKVTVAGIPHPEGQLNLLEGTPIEGGGYTTRIVQTSYLISGNTAGGNYTVPYNAQVLPGEHIYSMEFTGTGNSGLAGRAESDPIVINVQPRAATPSSVVFTWDVGSPAPPYQTVTFQGLTTPNSFSTKGTCRWLIVDMGSGGAKLSVDSQALNGRLGDQVCTLQVKDLQTATGGYFEVPVTLRTRARLLAPNPGSFDFLTTVGGSVSASFPVTAEAGSRLPLTVTSSEPWLVTAQLTLDSSETPATVSVLVANAGGLGTTRAYVTVSSPYASNTLQIPVTVTVVHPTIIRTNPSGLQVKADGVTYNSPVSLAWRPASQHVVEVQLTYNATAADTRYRFTTWANGSTSPVISQVGSEYGGTITASFVTDYRVRTTAVPENGGTITYSPYTPDGYLQAGTTVNLIATARQGYRFQGWTSPITASEPTRNFTLTAPASVVGVFTQVVGVPLNLRSSNGAPTSVIVNNVLYTMPATLSFPPGTPITVNAQTPYPLPANNATRLAFTGWNQLGDNPIHTFTMPAAAYTLTASYKTQHFVSLLTSPVNAGTVSGGGWYDEGSAAPISAAPNAGYAFSNFSGGITGTQNPRVIPVIAPVVATANFGPSGRPQFLVTTAAARESSAPDRRTVPLTVMNLSTSAAIDARIISVTDIAVVSGTGTVSPVTPMPLLLGTLGPNGASATPILDFQWPSTATRIQFKVNYTANNGTYSGSTTLTIFR